MSSQEFSNEPVDLAGIPRLDDDAFVPVDPNYLRVSLLGSAIFAAIALVAGVVVAVLVPSNSWIPLVVAAGVIVLTGLSAVLKSIEVKNIAYQVREHDLSYRSGVLIKNVETVPFVRVQHARVTRGPVERAFGLASLAVNSAGPDLNIAGLAADDAERLRALVVERAGELVEES